MAGMRMLPAAAIWDVADGTLVTATSAIWEVTCTDLDTGRTRWIARRDMGPLRLTDADRAALEAILVASVTRDAGGTEPTSAARAALVAQMTFPQSRPVLADVRLAPSGDVWVRNATQVQEMGHEALRVGSASGYGGTDWDVLDRAGMLEHSIRMPKHFRVTQFTDGWAYGILTDSLGVQRPARVATPT